jgi:hypothetical protein
MLSFPLYETDALLGRFERVSLECLLDSGARTVRIQDKSKVTGLLTLPVSVLGERFASFKFKVQKGMVYHMASLLLEKEVRGHVCVWLFSRLHRSAPARPSSTTPCPTCSTTTRLRVLSLPGCVPPSAVSRHATRSGNRPTRLCPSWLA